MKIKGTPMNRTKATIALSITLSVVATTLILPILAPLIRELHLSVLQGGLIRICNSCLVDRKAAKAMP